MKSNPNFDFVLLDKDHFGAEYDNRDRQLPAEIHPSYNNLSNTLFLVKGGERIATFERKDIPADVSKRKVIVLPIELDALLNSLMRELTAVGVNM